MNEFKMDDLILLLRQILREKEGRAKSVERFVMEAANLESTIEGSAQENIFEIMKDLALDLSYYEFDSKVRQQESSFYGDERLEELILDALTKINPLS